MKAPGPSGPFPVKKNLFEYLSDFLEKFLGHLTENKSFSDFGSGRIYFETEI